jgi:hypothetical protein
MRQGLINLLGTWWRSNHGELEACRRELSEALERETASSEILGIISSSPSDLESIFEAILANATRLCEASYGTLWLCEGDAVRRAAFHGSMPAAYAAARRKGPQYCVRRARAINSTQATDTQKTTKRILAGEHLEPGREFQVRRMPMKSTFLGRDKIG